MHSLQAGFFIIRSLIKTFSLVNLENPYAAPETIETVNPTAQVDPTSYYVEGNQLFVRDGTELPNICIRTGEKIPQEKRHKKTLYWASPWWALLIFAGILVYAIVYLCVRKKFTIHYSISKKALVKRRLSLGLLLSLSLAGLPAAVYFGSLTDKNSIYISITWIMVIGSLVGLIVAAIFSNLFRPKKHHEGWFTIAGVSKRFLEALHTRETKLTS